MKPLVWFSARSRLFWLEKGYLWTFSRVSWAWWLVGVSAGPTMGGHLLPESDVERIAESHGTPFRPRVEAPGDCRRCGEHVEEAQRVSFGQRGPFCGVTCLELYLRDRPPGTAVEEVTRDGRVFRPTVDRRSTRRA